MTEPRLSAAFRALMFFYCGVAASEGSLQERFSDALRVFGPDFPVDVSSFKTAGASDALAVVTQIGYRDWRASLHDDMSDEEITEALMKLVTLISRCAGELPLPYEGFW